MLSPGKSIGLLGSRIYTYAAIGLLTGLFLLSFPNPCCSEPTRLKLTFGVRQEYNDNIFFDQDDKTSDLITTGIFGVDLGYVTERLNAHAIARWEAYSYLDNSELDDVDQNYRLTLDYQFTPRLNGDVTGIYIRDFRRDRETETTGTIFENEERKRTEVQTSWEYLPSEIIALNLYATYWKDEFERAPTFQEELRDLEAFGGNFGVTHALRMLHRPVYGRGNIGYYHYRYPTNETDYYYLNIGFSAELDEKFSLLLDIGPRYQRSKYTTVGIPSGGVSTTTTTRDWGGSGKVSLVYAGEKTNWEAAISREVVANSGQNQPVDRTEARFDWDHWFNWEWQGLFTFRYFINESDQDRESPVFRDIDEDILVFHPRVRYRIDHDFYIVGRYRFIWKDNNEIDERTERNQAIIELVYNWPIWE